MTTNDDAIKKQRRRLREVGLVEKVGPSAARFFNNNSDIRNTIGFDLVPDPDIKIAPPPAQNQEQTPVSFAPPADLNTKAVPTPPIVREKSSLRQPLFRADIQTRFDAGLPPIGSRLPPVGDVSTGIPARVPMGIKPDTMFGEAPPQLPGSAKSSSPLTARLQTFAEQLGVPLTGEQVDRLTRQDLTGVSSRKAALDNGMSIEVLQLLQTASGVLKGKISPEVLKQSLSPLPTPEQVGGAKGLFGGQPTVGEITALSTAKGAVRMLPPVFLTELAAAAANRFAPNTSIGNLGKTIGELANADVVRGLRTPRNATEAIIPQVGEAIGTLGGIALTGGLGGTAGRLARATTPLGPVNVAARVGSRVGRGVFGQAAKLIPGAGRVASGARNLIRGAGVLTGGFAGGITAFRATDLAKDFISNKVTLAQLTKESLKAAPDFGQSLLRLNEDGVKLISKLSETGDLTPEEQDRLASSIGTASLAVFMAASAVGGARPVANRTGGDVSPVPVETSFLKKGEIGRLAPPREETAPRTENVSGPNVLQRAIAVRARRVAEGSATEQDVNALKSFLIQGGVQPDAVEATIRGIAAQEIPVNRVVDSMDARPQKPKEIEKKPLVPGRVMFLRNEIKRRFRTAVNQGSSPRRLNSLQSLLIRGGFEGQEAKAAVQDVLSGRVSTQNILNRVGRKRETVRESPEPVPQKRLENLKKLLEGPQRNRVPRVSRPSGPVEPKPGRPIITPSPLKPSVGEVGVRVGTEVTRKPKTPRRSRRLVPKKQPPALKGTTVIKSRTDFIRAAEEIQANPTVKNRVEVLRNNALLRVIGSESGRSGEDASRILKRLREKDITPQQAADMIRRFRSAKEQPQGIQQSKAARPVKVGTTGTPPDIRAVRGEPIRRPPIAAAGAAGKPEGLGKPAPVGRGSEARPQPEAGPARSGKVGFIERAALENDLRKLSVLKSDFVNMESASFSDANRKAFKKRADRLKAELSRKYDPEKLSQVQKGSLIVEDIESLKDIRKDSPKPDESRSVVPVQKTTPLGTEIQKAVKPGEKATPAKINAIVNKKAEPVEIVPRTKVGTAVSSPLVVTPKTVGEKQEIKRGKGTTASGGKATQKPIKAEGELERTTKASSKRAGTVQVQPAKTLEEEADRSLTDRIAVAKKQKRGDMVKFLERERKSIGEKISALRKFEKERDTNGLSLAIDNSREIMATLGNSKEGIRILSAIDEVHRRDMERIAIDENTSLFVRRGLKKFSLKRKFSEGGEGKKKTMSVSQVVDAMRKLSPKPAKKKATTTRKPTFSTLPNAPIKRKGQSEIQNKVETLRPATNKHETRYAIDGILVEKRRAAATDGHRAHILTLPEGHGAKLGVHRNKGGISDSGGFPKIDDVIPEKSSKNVFDVKILDQLQAITRAATVTSEESKGIAIVKNPDGTLGYAAYAPEVGHAEINIKPGGEVVGGANPDFLLDAFEFVSRNGSETARVQFPESNKPIVIESENAKAVVMPVKLLNPNGLISENNPPPAAKPAPEASDPFLAEDEPPTPRFRVDTIGDPGFASFFASRQDGIDVALGLASRKLEGAAKATGRLVKEASQQISDYSLVDMVKRAMLSGKGPARFRLAVLSRRVLNKAAVTRGELASIKIKLLKRSGAMPFTKNGKVNSEFQEQVDITILPQKEGEDTVSFGFTKLERVLNGKLPESVLSDRARETLNLFKQLTIKTGDVLMAVKTMQEDSRGRLRAFVTQPDGKVFLRLFSRSWYDAMYAGKGPLYDATVRSVAEANKDFGMTLNDSRAIHKEIHEGVSGRSGKGISRQFNVERVREIREYPTFVRIGGQNYQLLRTNPFEYVNALTERTARKVGFTSVFGQPQFAQKLGLEDKVAKLRSQYIEQDGAPERFDDLMKTLNGIPVEQPFLEPGSTMYAAARGFIDFTRFIKGLNITGTGIYNTFEPLGNIQAFGGISDFIKSAKRLSLDFRATTDAMEELGLIVIDRANKSYDPTEPVRSVMRMLSDTAIQAIGLQFQMNHPTRMAPVMGLEMAKRLRAGKGTTGDRFMLETLGYSRGEVNQFISGKVSPEVEYSMVSRLSENLTGFPRDATTETRFQKKRVLQQLFPFQTFAFRALRRFADISKNFISGVSRDVENKDMKAVGAKVFRYNRYLFGLTAAGAISDMVTALFMGGVPGLKQRATEVTADPERFGKYLLNSLVYQVVAGPFGGFIRQMQRGDVSTSRDLLERTYYGFLAFQVKDAIMGEGAYRDLDGFSRIGKAITRMTPIFKFAGGTMSMFGVATEENKANVARRAYFNWTHTRPSEGKFFPGSAQKEEGYMEFRSNIRRAVRAIQKREGMDVVNEHVQAALNVDGKLPKDVAAALRSRQFLRGLTAKEVGLTRGKDGKFPKGSLRRSLTEDSWRAIVSHDALIESWAMAVQGISAPSISPIAEAIRREAAGGKGKVSEAAGKLKVRAFLLGKGVGQLEKPESGPQNKLLKRMEARRRKAG